MNRYPDVKGLYEGQGVRRRVQRPAPHLPLATEVRVRRGVMALRTRVSVTRLSKACFVFAFVAAACGAPKAGKIAVMEFEANETVTAVSRFDEPLAGLGSTLAEHAVEKLRDRRHDAVAVPAGSEPDADYIVTGRITKVDGGNRALRAVIGFGAGGGYCEVEGQVVRKDGVRMGTFTVDHKEKTAGWFWANYGQSAGKQMHMCAEDLGEDVGEVVDEQHYQKERPPLTAQPAAVPPPGSGVPSQPATATAPLTPRTSSERLRDLDALHEQGLLTDEEYKVKRRRIIDEL